MAKDVPEETKDQAATWSLLALVYGYNALANRAETLGEKVYLRLARDTARAEMEATGGAKLVDTPQELGEPTLILAAHRCPHIVFHERDIEMMRVAVAAYDTKKLALRAAAEACGTNTDNPDTCGVCHLHFDECEADRSSHDLPPAADFPSCPGARVRAALGGW